MLMIFPAIGILLLIAFLFAAFVFCGILWTLFRLALSLAGIPPRLAGGKSPPAAALGAPWSGPQVRRPVPSIRPSAPPPTGVTAESTMWPKWNAAHRSYTDREKSLWQEQFDALNSGG
ncbi:hypothetical protein QFZ61_003269 [Arthrobacter sp. B3I4]|nr:hypothetical protein [Arthrobacter sp. B3I4]